MFDRAAILSTAHAATQARLAPSSSWRDGDRYDAEVCGWVPKASYKAIFAGCLRWAWREAKIIAEDQAWEAAQPPLPDAIADRIHELRAEAWASPITMRGNEMHAALLDQARDIEEAARAAL